MSVETVMEETFDRKFDFFSLLTRKLISTITEIRNIIEKPVDVLRLNIILYIIDLGTPFPSTTLQLRFQRDI